ncbi:MAG: hypothetical protein R3217_06945 [Gammaproteobacteria bacterium]|nr:hypothetical protein [Gammaproteobacteria bacterium]
MKYVLIVVMLFSAKVVLSACDFGEDDYDSGSSGSYSLSPRIINEGFGTSCNTQVATQCAAADVRYAQYEECIYTYSGDSATQAQCEGYYDNYVIQANLCQSTYDSLGC